MISKICIKTKVYSRITKYMLKALKEIVFCNKNIWNTCFYYDYFGRPIILRGAAKFGNYQKIPSISQKGDFQKLHCHIQLYHH